MKNKKLQIESFGGNERTPSESAPIVYINSNPVVKDIVGLFKTVKSFKDIGLIKILEDGDVYHMDLRFEINGEQHAQYAREEAKHKAYDIKRQLEMLLMTKYNIPSFSIAGVRVVQGVKTYCEFSISFIYANKGNVKPTNESIEKDLRVRQLVETALKTKPPVKKNIDPLKEALKNSIKESDSQFPIKEEEGVKEKEPSEEDLVQEAKQKRNNALNFLERMGEITREEKE